MLACLCTVKLQKEAVCLYYVYFLCKMYCCYKSGKSQGNVRVLITGRQSQEKVREFYGIMTEGLDN